MLVLSSEQCQLYLLQKDINTGTAQKSWEDAWSWRVQDCVKMYEPALAMSECAKGLSEKRSLSHLGVLESKPQAEDVE